MANDKKHPGFLENPEGVSLPFLHHTSKGEYVCTRGKDGKIFVKPLTVGLKSHILADHAALRKLDVE